MTQNWLIFPFLPLFSFFFSINIAAQTDYQTSLLQLKQERFEKAIQFNNEELMELFGEYEHHADFFVGKTLLQAHFRDSKTNLFSGLGLSGEEMVQFERDFSVYLFRRFEETDTIIVSRPSKSVIVQGLTEPAYMLSDFDFALFIVLRSYYGKAIESGDIQIRKTATGEQVDYLVKKQAIRYNESVVSTDKFGNQKITDNLCCTTTSYLILYSEIAVFSVEQCEEMNR